MVVQPDGLASQGRSRAPWSGHSVPPKEIAGDLQGWSKRKCVQEFRASLTFTLMAFVAKQLRAAEDASPHLPGVNQIATPFRGGNLFTEQDLKNWDTEEEVFIGPIRVRGVRPKDPLPLEC